MPLTTKDYKKILDIVDIAYSIPERTEMLRTVFDELKQILSFTTAVYLPASSENNFESDGSFAYEHADKLVHTYLNHYAPLDPFTSCGNAMNYLNQGWRITDVISASRLSETEFACDFLVSRFGIFWVRNTFKFPG